MSLVGKNAPAFVSPAVLEGGARTDATFSLSRYSKEGKGVLFFFFPKAFTSVCHSELLAFQESLHEFERAGFGIVACSTDSDSVLEAWLKTSPPTGIKGVTYPLVSDWTKTISYNYEVLAGDWEAEDDGKLIFEGGPPISYRGTFLIDKKGVVRHQLVNDFLLGRRVEESLRMIHALKRLDEQGLECPANWRPE